MLNLKTQSKVSCEDAYDSKNPFSPTFETPTHHVYIPLVPKHKESRCLVCKNMCCLIMIAVITVTIVIVVIILRE